MLRKINKTQERLSKLQNVLPRTIPLTLCKSFVRPHLDYGDIIYDIAYHNFFHKKLERTQDNACLAITRITRGTSKEKFTKNQVWSLFNTADGTENYVHFTKS